MYGIAAGRRKGSAGRRNGQKNSDFRKRQPPPLELAVINQFKKTASYLVPPLEQVLRSVLERQISPRAHRAEPPVGESTGGTFLQVVQTYVVYRIVGPDRKVPIGELVERRRTDRKNNIEDMLRLARKVYSSSTFEALEITVEPA